MLIPAVTFAAVLPALLAGHQLGDHVAQTDAMATRKALPGRQGWSAIARHAAAYHVITAALLLAVSTVLHLGLHPAAALLALSWSAGTHALLDRRWPVRRILRATRAEGFADLNTGGLNGLYLADQALHHACLLVSALLLTLPY